MRSRTRLTGGIVLVAVAALASVLSRPDLSAEVAIHFDAAGQPDGYAARDVALAFLPATMLGVLVLFELLPRIDPLRENIEAFERVYDVLVLSTLASLAGVHGLVLAFNLGYGVPLGVAVALGIAGLYVVIGFVLDRVERNWVVGVRNPWTLSDETVWERTHERTATAFKLGGVAALLATVLAPDRAILAVVGIGLLVAAYATAYSYVLYRRRHRGGEPPTP